jgi:hypothetical protein
VGEMGKSFLRDEERCVVRRGRRLLFVLHMSLVVRREGGVGRVVLDDVPREVDQQRFSCSAVCWHPFGWEKKTWAPMWTQLWGLRQLRFGTGVT